MSESKIKKVNPYPILVQFDAITGRIVKLAMTGFLVETTTPLKVNHQYNSQFVLPVLNVAIPFVGVVVKTYDRLVGQEGGSAQSVKLAEIFFKGITQESKETIRDFLKRIGQAR